jgi:predicted transcriptional regulator
MSLRKDTSLSTLRSVMKPLILVLNAIARNGGRARATEIIESLRGISPTVIYTNLRKAMLEGLVTREGEHYTLTQKGREFLKSAIEEIKRLVEGAEKVE